MGARTPYNLFMRRTFVPLLIVILAAACAPIPTPDVYHLQGPYIPPNAYWPKGKRIEVTATAYAVGDGSGWRTYTGTRVRPGIIAVSHDLKWVLGRHVLIRGMGTYRAEDLMHSRWRHRIDIWYPSLRHAKQFGVQQHVIMEVYR